MNATRPSIFNRILFGYESLEPCILASIALGGKNHLFIEGTHGIGKTTLGKTLALALDDTGRGFRYYPCDKLDMITMCGMPDVEAMKRGEFKFVPTQQSIWGAKLVILDELNRGGKEQQNYCLEALEEGTVKGIKHGVEMFIATGNNQTYKGTMDTDLALRSRFLFWLPAPSFRRELQSDQVESMVRLNIERRDGFTKSQMEPFAREIRELVAEMRSIIDDVYEDEAKMRQITQFIGTFIQLLTERVNLSATLGDNDDAYVSPREFAAQFHRAIIGLYAYFKTLGYDNALQMAGEEAVKYNIESRHAVAGEEFVQVCSTAWQQTMGMLVSNIDTPEGKIEMEFARCLNGPQKIAFWKEYLDEAAQILPPERLRDMTGVTLSQVQTDNMEHIGLLWSVMRGNDKTKSLAAQVEGTIITELCRLVMSGNNGGDTSVLYTEYFQQTSLTTDGVSDILSYSSAGA